MRYHDGRLAGQHAVMKATMSGVEMFLLAYAWSNKQVAYIISSCEMTVPHEIPYRTHFTDDYGNVTFKELLRPSIAHFYFELCPLIDNHNKDRQGILGLEDCWPTKSPSFRLVTTLIGMSVVGMHQWDRNKRSGGKSFDWMNADEERPDFLMVRSMANLVAKGLHQGNMQYYNEKTPRPTIPLQSRRQFQPLETMALVRICDSEGNIRRPNGGKEFQQTCMICCQYWKKQQNTQWRCGRCRMPMCKKKRRDVTCFQEHCEMIGDPVLGCGPHRIHFALPTEYRKYESRTEMLEEQPAYDHHIEDEAGSEKSKSTSAAAGGKGKSNRPWKGGSATNYSTTLGSGKHHSPLSFTDEAGNEK